MRQVHFENNLHIGEIYLLVSTGEYIDPYRGFFLKCCLTRLKKNYKISLLFVLFDLWFEAGG